MLECTHHIVHTQRRHSTHQLVPPLLSLFDLIILCVLFSSFPSPQPVVPYGIPTRFIGECCARNTECMLSLPHSNLSCHCSPSPQPPSSSTDNIRRSARLAMDPSWLRTFLVSSRLPFSDVQLHLFCSTCLNCHCHCAFMFCIKTFKKRLSWLSYTP